MIHQDWEISLNAVLEDDVKHDLQTLSLVLLRSLLLSEYEKCRFYKIHALNAFYSLGLDRLLASTSGYLTASNAAQLKMIRIIRIFGMEPNTPGKMAVSEAFCRAGSILAGIIGQHRVASSLSTTYLEELGSLESELNDWRDEVLKRPSCWDLENNPLEDHSDNIQLALVRRNPINLQV